MGNINPYNSGLSKHLSMMIIYYERGDMYLFVHVCNIHLRALWGVLEAILCEHLSQKEFFVGW